MDNIAAKNGRAWAIPATLSVGIVALVVADAYLSWISAATRPSWLLAEYTSPSNLGSAVFLSEGGWAGSDTYLFVRDTTKSGKKPLRIGGPYASDGNVKFQDAVWSRDGSVFAVRIRAGQPEGKSVSQFGSRYWLDAYDFRNHGYISDGTTVLERSAFIERLIAKRGGASSQAITSWMNDAKDVSLRVAAAFDTSHEDHQDIGDMLKHNWSGAQE